MTVAGMPNDHILVDPDRLKTQVAAIFEHLKLPVNDAETVADVLVQADLWGITTHGVSNYIKGIYVPLLLDKTITSNPTIKILSEGSSVALLDGDGGMGHVVSVHAMELAIEKAMKTGIGAVSVTNSTHFGAAGFYSHMAAEKNMIGISMTNAATRVVPLYGKNAMLGTNPLSIAAPTNKVHPFLLDMATSTVSAGKLYVAALNGGMIPEGWATNIEGQPTSDPVEGLESKRLLPLGGTKDLGGHKGYGLGIAVDILSGVLSGIGYGNVLPYRHVGHFFCAVNISKFRGIDAFKNMMDEMILELLDTPSSKQGEAVSFPGEIEATTMVERKRYGIPLHNEVIDYLDSLASEMNISVKLTT